MNLNKSANLLWYADDFPLAQKPTTLTIQKFHQPPLRSGA
jgi:hypothetical protein